jgi:hypothetical protein
MININAILVKFATQDLVLSKNETERSKIETSLNTLESKLKNGLGNNILEFKRFGSFTRNTILPRQFDQKSDVDLMVIMNNSIKLHTPNTYRTWIKDVVDKAYPNSISSKDFPVVKLKLNHIMFDLVPAYKVVNAWPFNVTYYYIPDKIIGWRNTAPNDINDSLSKQNQATGNNTLRNVIRLCKHWNASTGYPLESYLMEKKIINNWYSYSSNDTTYDKFLEVMKLIAGDKPGVKEALDHIKTYKGNFFNEPNVDKQKEWLKRLLPGLY